MNSSKNAPLIKIWLFVLVFLPLTLKLGVWQIERSDEKQALLSMMDQRFSSPSVVLDNRQPILPFRRYNLTGHFEEQHYLLDNRIRDGQVGYELISPFYISGGKHLAYVMVNRGWIKAGKYREHLPEITTPVGVVGLEGYFHETDGKVPVLKETPRLDGWPQRVQQVSWHNFKQQLSGELLFEYEFRLLEGMKEAGVQEQQLAKKELPTKEIQENTDLSASLHYKLGWPRTTILPEKHTAYAFQWFALAMALLILAMSATYKIRIENKRNE